MEFTELDELDKIIAYSKQNNEIDAMFGDLTEITSE